MLCAPLENYQKYAGRIGQMTNPPCCIATASTASESGSQLVTNPANIVFFGHQSATFRGFEDRVDDSGATSQQEIIDHIPLYTVRIYRPP